VAGKTRRKGKFTAGAGEQGCERLMRVKPPSKAKDLEDAARRKAL